MIPFYYDTLFSGIWGEGHDLLNKEVQEISNAEFMEAFEQRLQEFKQRIDKANGSERQ